MLCAFGMKIERYEAKAKNGLSNSVRVKTQSFHEFSRLK